jgi:branched-chain amino acid transport system substrate-binding protein
VQSFIKTYKEKYGQDPIVYSATGYDAVNILAGVIKESGDTPAAIAQGLYKVNHRGASGLTKIGANGLAPKEVYFKVVKGGKWVNYKP